MVNDVVLSYIEKNRGLFPMKDIRAKILSRGYSKEDIDEALDVLKKKEIVLDKDVELKQKVGFRESAPKKRARFKWMKLAGVVGVVFFVFLLVNFVLGVLVGVDVSNSIGGWIMLGLLAVLIVLTCFYFYGFIRMGKSVDSKLLRGAAIMNIVSVLLFVALMVFMIIITWMMFSTISSGLSDGVGFGGNFETWAYLFYLFGVVTLVSVFVSRVLFSISLIRVRKKVGFLLIAGVLGLIVAVLLLVLYGISIYLAMNPFGFLVSIDSFIEYLAMGFGVLSMIMILFESLSLFNSSKKFE